MAWGRGASLVLAACVLAAFLPALPARGDTEPPTVTELQWTPKYAIHPSNITISARVTDPDDVSNVRATFCYAPPWICLYEPMTDPDADDVYTATPIGPGGHTTQPELGTQSKPGIVGAQLSVSAEDSVGNSIILGKFDVLFVDTIKLSLDAPVFASGPGQPFTVRGHAYYEANTSAPAEGVAVTVQVPGSQQPAVVAANGSFEATMTAPATESTYTITANVTDRTLTDTAEATLAVSTTPKPDLTASDLRVAVASPRAGPVSFAFHAKNVGTLQAQDVRVLVEVLSTTPVVIFDDRLTIPGNGGSIPLVATGSLAAGTHTVRVTVDPDDGVDELNEGNNVETLIVVVAAQPESGPPLVLLGGGAAIAAAGVAGALLWRRHRRKTDASQHGKD